MREETFAERVFSVRIAEEEARLRRLVEMGGKFVIPPTVAPRRGAFRPGGGSGGQPDRSGPLARRIAEGQP
jgi:hypothetical protein